MNRLLFWLGFILCLGVPVALVAHQEKLRRGSVVIYLRLAPVWSGRPNLDYDLNLRPLDPNWPAQGFLRPDLDSRRVVTAWAPDSQAPPGQRIGYRVVDSRLQLDVTIPPDATQSGEARYAKFYLAQDGRLTFVGLTNWMLGSL